MDDSKLGRYFLAGLLIVFLYLAILTVAPVMKNIILAFVFSFIFYPIYKWLFVKTNRPNLSASLMILILILVLVIPGALVINSLVGQTINVYQAASNADLSKINNVIPGFLSGTIDLNLYFDDITLKGRDFIVEKTPDIIGSVTELMLGLFIMFFIMFYAFRDGDKWIIYIEEKLPLKHEYTKKLMQNTENITQAVLYGYVLTAAIQGTLGGLMFFILQIPNPIFWGFVMAIMAAIPFLGTPLVFVPAAILLIVGGKYVSAIVLLIFGFVVLMNIDNFIRPKLIGSKAKVHPAIILVGVLGGLAMFGFTGIILGPLVLTMLMVLLKFFALELATR